MRLSNKIFCYILIASISLSTVVPVYAQEEGLFSEDNSAISDSVTPSDSGDSSPISFPEEDSSTTSPADTASTVTSSETSVNITDSTTSNQSYPFASSDPVPTFTWTDSMDTALKNGCSYLKLNENFTGYLFVTGISGIESDITVATRVLDEIEEKQGQYSSVYELCKDILILTFNSLNPADFRGINLIEELATTPLLEDAGLPEQAVALITMDSGKSSIPDHAVNSRNALISRILACQQENGGFSSSQGDSDTNIAHTAIAIIALSPYQQKSAMIQPLQEALAYLQSTTFPTDSKTLSQLIIALSSLSLSPTDTRFTKGSSDLVSTLLSYQMQDGGFSQTKGANTADISSTEYAVIALTAVKQQTNPFVLQNSTSFHQEEDSLSPLIIAEIVAGSLLLMVAIGTIIIIFVQKKRHNK